MYYAGICLEIPAAVSLRRAMWMLVPLAKDTGIAGSTASAMDGTLELLPVDGLLERSLVGSSIIKIEYIL